MPSPAPDGTIEVTVRLPDGSSLDPAELTVLSMLVPAPVDADGRAYALHAPGNVNTVYVLDRDDDVVMAAFIDDRRREVTAETTAETLLYYGLGSTLRDFAVQTQIRTALTSSVGFSRWASTVGAGIVADAKYVGRGAFTEDLARYIGELDASIETLDIGLAAILVNPTNRTSGLQVAEVDDSHFSVTNHRQRRAHGFLYKTASIDRAGTLTVVDAEISGTDIAQAETPIQPTAAITGFVGVLQDWAAGKGADWAATTSEPLLAEVGSDEREARYVLRAIGLGQRAPGLVLTDAEQDRLDTIALETFVFDFVLPLFLEAVGQTDAVKKLGSADLQKFLREVEPVLSAIPALNEKLSANDPVGAFQDFFFAIVNNTSSGLVEFMVDATLDLLFTGLSADRFDYDNISARRDVGRVLRALAVVDASLKIIDYGRKYFDNGTLQTLTEFDIVARHGEVRLEPEIESTVPFEPRTLKAFAKTTPGPDTVLEYRWSTSGQVGRLYDDRGGSGSDFTSSRDSVDYISEQLVQERVTEWVRVEVYSRHLNDAPVLIGTDTSTITVVRKEQIIMPRDLTIKCRRNVQLYLRRSDGQVTINENPSWDYRVDWTTSGEYGKLEGGETSVRRFNTNSVRYECTDREAMEVTERFRARIYIKEKGAPDGTYRLHDDVAGTIKIDNDEYKAILHLPLRITTYEVPQQNPAYAGWSTILSAVIPPPDRARRYNARVYGLRNDIPGVFNARLSWDAGDPIPAPLPLFARDDPDAILHRGNYEWYLGATGCQGGPNACNAMAAAEWEAAYRRQGGFVEVIVQLDPP